MSTFKKLLALALALAMVLSFSVFAGDYKDDTYKDQQLIDKNCAAAVELMYALDIMKGDANGNFNPTGTITRAEIAKMIYVVLNKGEDDQAANFKYNTMFSDVPGDAWYAGYVNYCAATKLIDGYNGKFNPMSPVTTAQAAKMLLTAIGYSSENRNYTGANWEKNVLADAAVVGLLSNYNWPTNQNAPRQWVAVMFENMLLGAYTYGTARPGTINGLLTGTMGELGNWSDVKTMGQKYFDLDDYTGYAYATKRACLDYAEARNGAFGKKDEKSEYAGGKSPTSANWIIFGDGSGLYDADGDYFINVYGSNLGYMDLGQEYRVIYSTKNDKVYSVRNTGTSVVGHAMQKDITTAISRGTDENDALNRYVYTIGDMEARFNSKTIKQLTVNRKAENSSAVKYDNITTEQMYRNHAGVLETDDYYAIDKDGNGRINYLIIKEYAYGQVTKTGNHKDYGEYFTADGVNGTLKPDGFMINSGNTVGSNWYLDDVVNCETEIEKNNVIKTVYNPDLVEYDVEVIPVETAEYEKRTNKGVHTLGGEEYLIAKNGFEEKETNSKLVNKYLRDDLTFAYDDNLIVLVGILGDNITDLAEVNAQLVMVTDARQDIYYQNRHNNFISYMTIDGELHSDVAYDDDAADDNGGVVFDRLLRNSTEELDGKNWYKNDAGEEVKDTAPWLSEAQKEAGWDGGYLWNDYRLFKLVETDDGAYLVRFATSEKAQSVLNYATTLLDNYSETIDGLNTKKAKFGDNYVEEDNLYFYSYRTGSYDKDGLPIYAFSVRTLDSMPKADKEQSAFFQALAKRSSTRVNTILAGHICAKLDAGSTGYLYSESGELWRTGRRANWQLDDVVFSDGTTADSIAVNWLDNENIKDITADNTREYDRIVEKMRGKVLYAYSYTEDIDGNRVYQLAMIDERAEKNDEEVTYDKAPEKSVTGIANFDAYDLKNTNKADPDNGAVELDSIRGRDRMLIADKYDLTLKSEYTIALRTVTWNRDHTLTDEEIADLIKEGEDLPFVEDAVETIQFMTYAELQAYLESTEYISIENGDADDSYSYYGDFWYVADKTDDVVDNNKVATLYIVLYAIEKPAQIER